MAVAVAIKSVSKILVNTNKAGMLTTTTKSPITTPTSKTVGSTFDGAEGGTRLLQNIVKN